MHQNTTYLRMALGLMSTTLFVGCGQLAADSSPLKTFAPGRAFSALSASGDANAKSSCTTQPSNMVTYCFQAADDGSVLVSEPFAGRPAWSLGGKISSTAKAALASSLEDGQVVVYVIGVDGVRYRRDLNQDWAPAPCGSGLLCDLASDVLVLNVAEDEFQGDAQFTVTVDGEQVSGVYTAKARRSDGKSDAISIRGQWGGPMIAHSVGVTFINDAYGGSFEQDRNLYVEGVSFDGYDQGISELALYAPGTQTVAIAPSLSDRIQVAISEDAFQGHAQFLVFVDGLQQGFAQDAASSHSAGQVTLHSYYGHWSSGRHIVTIYFVNDPFGGSAGADRNLYVEGVNYYRGTKTAGALNFNMVDSQFREIPLYSNGSATFAVGN